MAFVYLIVVLVAIIAVAIGCFSALSLIPAIIVVVIGAPLALWIAVTLYGLVLRARPLRPFDEAEQKRSAAEVGGEGRHITTPDGRIVEYLVYGSKDPDAKVIVQMHGSTTTGAWQCRMQASLLEQLNLKGIAPSVPGHGYSDIHVGRRLVDFPKDLEVILAAEGVDQFMVEGTSFGTGHAMAIAWHFPPERCVALGLVVPYLSDQICKEYKLESKADPLPKTETRVWHAAWNFFAADLQFDFPFVGPLVPLFLKYTSDGKVTHEQRPWALEAIADSQRGPLTARGTQGQGYEQYSFKVSVDWGFDPREIKTRNIAVWYAMDDWACFPTHGEWIADYFGAREDVKMNVRREEIGLGHYTYMPAHGHAYQISEQTMAKTLLDLCAD